MSPWERFFSSRNARKRSPIIIRGLSHMASTGARIIPDGKSREILCNLSAMSDVEKPVLDTVATAETSTRPKAAHAEAERALVRKAQQGDASAYEQLVRMHQQRIL